MGCCLSTGAGTNHDIRHSPPRPRPPPPPPVEEETVKEVLSETPISKRVIQTHSQATSMEDLSNNSKIAHPQEEEEDERVITKPDPAFIDNPEVPAEAELPQESLEASQTCTVSESFSTSTVRDDEVTSGERKAGEGGTKSLRVGRSPTKRLRKRPNSGEVSGEKHRRISRSPAKRLESAQNVSRAQASGRNRRVGPTGIRRDSGEVLRRRSQSPATRRGSPSPVSSRGDGEASLRAGVKGTRAAGSRSLVPAAAVDEKKSPKAEEEKREGTESNGSGSGLAAPSESLDNPLVSLECFIFL